MSLKDQLKTTVDDLATIKKPPKPVSDNKEGK